MELQLARQIVDALAQGVHPITGEVMPDDSPYNAPPIIRALHVVSRALEAAPAAAVEPRPHRGERVSRAAPANAGKPWTADEDAALEAGFALGSELKDLAESLGRTRFGIEQRLIKLGKLPAPHGGGRFAPAMANGSHGPAHAAS